MGGGATAKDHPLEYLIASGAAAAINYPLWRASAMAQSGFTVGRGARSTNMFVYAFVPPYKGMVGVISGMTWARAAIFWGSDYGKAALSKHDFPDFYATVIPPLLVSSFVQCVNQPIVRASITLQNPKSGLNSTWSSIRHIYTNHGATGLWHGTSAGILKTVPKYCTAIVVKDFMENTLPQIDDQTSPNYDRDRLCRSAIKSATAGVAGAALTNPFDVIRNEMFKTNESLPRTVRRLTEEGSGFITRGMTKNMIAVAIPVSCTIFFTDILIQIKNM